MTGVQTCALPIFQSAGPKLASNRPATPLTKPSNLVPTPQAAAASQPVNPVVKPEPSQPQPIKDATPTEAVVKASKAPTTNTADDSKPISQPASIKFDQSKDLPTASKPTVTPQATSDVQQPAKDDSSSSPPPVDRKSTRLNSSHIPLSRMPSSA